MRFAFSLLLALVIALATGFGVSWYALEDGRFFGALKLGPWAAWPAAGGNEVDPYTRAWLARSGQLQLGRSEGMRFLAIANSGGSPLDLACTYRIEGNTPVATMWILYARTPDGAVIGIDGRRPFVDSVTLPREPDGSFAVAAGPDPVPGVWLATTGSGNYELVLDIYDTSVFAGLGATLDVMPAIYPEGCE